MLGILYSWYVESEDFEDAEEQDAVNHFKQAVEEIQTLEVIPLEFRGANFQDEESGKLSILTMKVVTEEPQAHTITT